METGTVLECRNVSHGFGAKPVLHDISIKLLRGEIVALVGPSGCGKSTLLRAILGTHPPREGCVEVTSPEGVTSAVRRPGRDRGIVYQQYGLFPFLTAVENVAFGLMLDETSLPGRFFGFFGLTGWRGLRKKHLAIAADMLDKMLLSSAKNLYPSEMSGGMRQRVAIAQALVLKPEILLLDEPFGALDEATREELQRLLLTLYAENIQEKKAGNPPPYTILIVTHELNEAIFVSDRVVAVSQYWNWREQGFDACPGATVVYDHVAPVFAPNAERDYEIFAAQRDEIRTAAFDPEANHSRNAFNHFWCQLTAGEGKGVLA